MQFNEQILEKNSNIIKSYTSSSITVSDKKYNYNVIVPPEKSIVKCVINTTNITKNLVLKNLNKNINFVILASNNTGCLNKTPIISELNRLGIGIEIMNIRAACCSHNILLSEKRNFLSFFIFE
jgi:uncharacterized protein